MISFTFPHFCTLAARTDAAARATFLWCRTGFFRAARAEDKDMNPAPKSHAADTPNISKYLF